MSIKHFSILGRFLFPAIRHLRAHAFANNYLPGACNFILKFSFIFCIFQYAKYSIAITAFLFLMMEIDTEKPVNVLDITGRVSQAVKESGIESGICLVYSLHTTCGLIVNEADDALIYDQLSLLERLVPKGAGYRHDRGDGNAHAHLRASLLGNSVVIPVEKSSPVLGTWQRILFLEMDGPRRRKIFVRTIPG